MPRIESKVVGWAPSPDMRAGWGWKVEKSELITLEDFCSWGIQVKPTKIWALGRRQGSGEMGHLGTPLNKLLEGKELSLCCLPLSHFLKSPPPLYSKNGSWIWFCRHHLMAVYVCHFGKSYSTPTTGSLWGSSNSLGRGIQWTITSLVGIHQGDFVCPWPEYVISLPISQDEDRGYRRPSSKPEAVLTLSVFTMPIKS